MPEATPQKIIIRTPNWLGDLMMSTVFIHAVLEQYPHAQVDLIVKAGFEQIPLAKRGEVYVFDKTQQSAGQFGALLKKHAYDRFYILPPSFSAAWMAFRSRALERIGYCGNLRDWLLKPALPYSHPPRTQHLIQEYLALLQSSLKVQQEFPRLALSPEWVAHQLHPLPLLPEKFVVLAPGAIYGSAKQWPTRYFQRMGALLEEQGWPVVLVGTQADYDDGETIARGRKYVSNWCGKTSLIELIAVLAKAQLLISNDSGSMHIMTALQRPQIAIFGSTSPTWTGPLNPKATVIYRALGCSPCFQKTCPLGHYNCLAQITPETVFEKAQTWLK